MYSKILIQVAKLFFSYTNKKFKNVFFAAIVTTVARQQVFRNSTDINNLNNQYADRLKLDLETLEILIGLLLLYKKVL